MLCSACCSLLLVPLLLAGGTSWGAVSHCSQFGAVCAERDQWTCWKALQSAPLAHKIISSYAKESLALSLQFFPRLHVRTRIDPVFGAASQRCLLSSPAAEGS